MQHYWMDTFRSIGQLFLKPHRWKPQLDRVRQNLELLRISRLPRHQPSLTTLLGAPFTLNDSLAFIWNYEDIFVKGMYAFKANHDHPTILDMGAQIGMSVLYFKQIYPNAHIIAIEPDRELFNLLQKNIQHAGCSHVEFVNKPISDNDIHLMVSSNAQSNAQSDNFHGNEVHGNEVHGNEVQTAGLRDYLTQPIDLLKIDLEGDEVSILSESFDRLSTVQNLFIEYHSFVNQPQYLEELISLLTHANFLFYIQPIGDPDPQPFLSQSHYLSADLSLNIFAFRES